MRNAVLAISLSAALAGPASAQLRLSLQTGTAVPAVRVAPTLGASLLQTSLSPAAGLMAPRLYAQPAAPLAAPAVLPEALRPIVDDKSLASALKPETPAAERSAALGRIFDGTLAAPALPGLGGGAVEMINGAYGFYSWLARQPEAASAQTQAGILIAALPALEKGPVIVMKDAAAVTVLSADDATAP
ncbi:MAG: hypothetical protein PHU21_10730, partial [Elusimicrobia bacterium]|nr:hypothetical protein [Elusimicrobiota bacterium]